MSGELEIRGGGAVAVDTDTLRTAASRFLAAGDELEESWQRLAVIRNQIAFEVGFDRAPMGTATVLWNSLREAIDEAARIAASLREAAAIYELVELAAQRHAMLGAGDADGAARVDARVSQLEARYPDAFAQARFLEFERAVMWPSHLVRQATQTGFAIGEDFSEHAAIIGGVVLGGAAIGFAATTGFSHSGLVGAGSRLTGGGMHPATLLPVAPLRTSTTAPTSLATALGRMPGAGESRVRVERYAMPDGTRQFAVYIAGTQSMAFGGDDPWDNQSNLELYGGTASASYEATLAALAAAGAEPGDTVQAFGHSQGGMIATHLALESGYDVRTLITLGSPVSGEVGSGTLAVEVRHTDDPIAALAGGGHMGGIGGPGSFVVLRESDPSAGAQDFALGAHLLPAYAETAAMVDASGDPRVDALGAMFDDLARADSVEVFEFGAVRADASRAGASQAPGAPGATSSGDAG